ncbi:hypothetical protein DSECCO2_416590 [anaerobic digester metagenome]
MIPACEAPSPSSSSAQIMPLLSMPRILAFFIVSDVPSDLYKVAPGKATSTFCPAATFGAPHTICNCSVPTSTFVSERCSVPSTWAHSSTWPTTIPFNPPLICSCSSRPSTSSPLSVRIFEMVSAGRSVFRYCFSQLYEIFILKIFSAKILNSRFSEFVYLHN